MAEPIEMVIIRAQQSFQISKKKKYKNARCRLIPLGLLFPASVKNNTEHL